MTEMINNECPKCGSESIARIDNEFSCNYCGLNFYCFGGKT